MALENKKLSTYDDLPSSNIDGTTKLVVITGSVKTNKNLPLANLVENSLSSTSSIKPLSAAKGKQLQDEKAQKSYTIIIDTGDFIPVNPQVSGSGYEYQITPGSYGVLFTDTPIEGLSDVNFNLKVDYVSHDGSGGDGYQDFIHTLTTATGRVFTRRVYMDNQQVGYVSTQFVENASDSSGGGSLIISATPPLNPKAGDVWIDGFIRYTYQDNKWIEI